MADQPGDHGRVRGLSTDRLDTLSDGVFAIAATLLVLDLAVPIDAEGNFLRAVADQWPSYLAYVVSFATIGVVWLEHSVTTEYLERADAVFIRLNLLLLLVVAFLPFPTKLLSAYPGKTGPERVAVTIYGVILLLANVLVRFLWRHAVRAKLLGVNPDGEEIRVLTRRLTPELASPAVLASYLVMIGLGLFAPTAAICGYLAIAVYFLVPLRPLRRQRHQREP